MTTFNPAILNSFENVQSFLEGRTAVQAVLAFEPEKTHVLDSRWTVVWIVVKAPFEWIFCVFLCALSCLLSCVGATDLSTRCDLLSGHLLADQERLYLHAFYGRDYIASSVGFHQWSTSDFYLQPSVLVESVDPKIKECVNSEKTEVRFYHSRGVCHGMSDWFAYLFFKTADQFTDPALHMQALTKLFEEGAPKEAALLHSLNDNDNATKLLGLERSQCLLEDNTPFGLYAVNLKHHRMNYIKSGEGLHFLFNPAGGTVCLHSATEVLGYIQEPFCLERLQLFSEIDLEKVI
jgi:hypothetical protein